MSELFEIKDTKYEREEFTFKPPSYSNIWYQQFKLLSSEYLDTGLIRNKTMQIFMQKVMRWIPEVCPCKLCKTYIHHVGYLRNKMFFLRILYLN